MKVVSPLRVVCEVKISCTPTLTKYSELMGSMYTKFKTDNFIVRVSMTLRSFLAALYKFFLIKDLDAERSQAPLFNFS